jgi:hypothetical protein
MGRRVSASFSNSTRPVDVSIKIADLAETDGGEVSACAHTVAGSAAATASSMYTAKTPSFLSLPCKFTVTGFDKARLRMFALILNAYMHLYEGTAAHIHSAAK